MKHLRTILLFLLLGAVVNVAVAWGCAYPANNSWGAKSGFDVVHTAEDAPCWQVRIFEHATTTSYVGSAVLEGDLHSYVIRPRLVGSGVEPVVPNWSQMHVRPDKKYKWYFEYSSGWPLRSFSGAVVTFGNPNYKEIDMWVLSYFPNAKMIPLTPIWLGFLTDTLVFAATLWLLTATLYSTRRVIRQRLGLCVKCAYDLKGAAHEACPECGVGVKPVSELQN